MRFWVAKTTCTCNKFYGYDVFLNSRWLFTVDIPKCRDYKTHDGVKRFKVFEFACSLFRIGDKNETY